MDLIEAIKNRRSIRNFSEKEVDNSLIEKIVDSANWAPSHCNTQAWRFVVVTDKEVKHKIKQAGGSPIIEKAPAFILILYQDISENLEYRDYIQSASAAIQNMTLTTHSLGLSSCWICHLPMKKDLRKLLSVPKDFIPIAGLALGYPKQDPINIPRKHNVPELISYNKFNFEFQKKSKIKIIIKRTAKKFYYLLPVFIKKKVFPFLDKYFIKKFEN